VPARRLDALPHRLLGYAGAYGFPVIVPVTISGHSGQGIALTDSCRRVAGALGCLSTPSGRS